MTISGASPTSSHDLAYLGLLGVPLAAGIPYALKKVIDKWRTSAPKFDLPKVRLPNFKLSKFKLPTFKPNPAEDAPRRFKASDIKSPHRMELTDEGPSDDRPSVPSPGDSAKDETPKDPESPSRPASPMDDEPHTDDEPSPPTEKTPWKPPRPL